jgi:hypothetical protein
MHLGKIIRWFMVFPLLFSAILSIFASHKRKVASDILKTSLMMNACTFFAPPKVDSGTK